MCCAVEERSLGSLRRSGEAAGRRWTLHPAPGGRRFRVRVGGAEGRSLALYEVQLASCGHIHLMFRSKLQVFQFLFSTAARAMDGVHLEVEDITESEVESKEEEGVRVRVSRELALAAPGLSPLSQLVPLTPGGLLSVAAVEQRVTAGRRVSAVRCRRRGVRSSKWETCVREGGLVLPPRPGGWAAAGDLVVFVEREQGKVVVDREIQTCSELPSTTMYPEPEPSTSVTSPTSSDPTSFTFVTIRPKLRRAAALN